MKRETSSMSTESSCIMSCSFHNSSNWFFIVDLLSLEKLTFHKTNRFSKRIKIKMQTNITRETLGKDKIRFEQAVRNCSSAEMGVYSSFS